MNTVVKIQPKDVGDIAFQDASFDIWDKKYRLTAKDGSPIDKSMDDTYKRVARALADVESEHCREQWYESFVWALRHGAIPAGRVTSNAGALEHKPATSTINCTVSGTIRDSMDDILNKVHEAGLTLKAGCGIGYEFSTLRPRGAYVSGAGGLHVGAAVVHGYLRQNVLYRVLRGRAARRADGHFRHRSSRRARVHSCQARGTAGCVQFNLSLLITDESHECGEERRRRLARLSRFPCRAQGVRGGSAGFGGRGQVCMARVAGLFGRDTSPTATAWSPARSTRPCMRAGCGTCIMSSTYDFAEPGFILVDRASTR